jgi:alpha-D-ribose 1-methylphosphonate 5-triphosphate synthase subunit PhnG
MGIPAKCRTKEALDNDRCAEILAARSVQRNKKGSQKDAKASAALKDAILGSRVKTGETVAQVLDQVSARIPFVVTGWNFVYARSGAEYAAIGEAGIVAWSARQSSARTLISPLTKKRTPGQALRKSSRRCAWESETIRSLASQSLTI